jgi:predicted RND superfamily exporter protein
MVLQGLNDVRQDLVSKRLIGQIKTNREEGLDPFHALVEATVQRSRPVVLTALAAVLAFIPLTFSAFWGSLAYTLIGGTAVGTVLTLVFLPALYLVQGKASGARKERSRTTSALTLPPSLSSEDALRITDELRDRNISIDQKL